MEEGTRGSVKLIIGGGVPPPYVVRTKRAPTPPLAPHLSLAPRAIGHLTTIRWSLAIEGHFP